MDYMKKAKELVLDYARKHLDPADNVSIDMDGVFVVWFGKTLHHAKTLLSTTLPDGMYYEVTFNGVKNEIYLDAYKKFENVCVSTEVGEE
ncbi:MAG: hypothetical protein E7434_01555 [Ruminococcaceae bacterium]|nr:hypothetical protein [Oscillospiraceae bacterium]